MARTIQDETWEQTGNNAVHVRRSKHFAECVAITEGDDRKQLAIAITSLPELIRGLTWYVENDPEFATLDKGIGTDTDAGKARLAARAALTKALASHEQ